MKAKDLQRVQSRLEQWLLDVMGGLGRRERVEALQAYVFGLLLEGERKSMEPLAHRIVAEPSQKEGMRQRLQQAIAVADWSESVVFERIARAAVRGLPDVDALVLDDTGFPKKGYKSVGVQRQYSGTLGRIDNCQVATSLHLASESGGVCIGMRLYLPQAWADDAKRRRMTGVPDDVEFREKWRLGLDLIDQARAWDVGDRVVVADAGYGDAGEFRDGLDARGLSYIVGVTGTAMAWPPGVTPYLPARVAGAAGRPRTRWIAPDGTKPMTMNELAALLPASRFRKVTWREGTRGPQSSRFAAMRIRTAHRYMFGKPPSNELWLICEWPRRQKVPSKLYLSNLPKRTPLRKMVYLAKLRWRIERDYQEMKSELGLDHFEGRGWRGFHHHVACVAAAHAFLALERVISPPERSAPDLADVPTHASARGPVPHRRLSALLSADRSAAASLAVADVIE
jgi:SRSO17 transposase